MQKKYRVKHIKSNDKNKDNFMILQNKSQVNLILDKNINKEIGQNKDKFMSNSVSKGKSNMMVEKSKLGGNRNNPYEYQQEQQESYMNKIKQKKCSVYSPERQNRTRSKTLPQKIQQFIGSPKRLKAVTDQQNENLNDESPQKQVNFYNMNNFPQPSSPHPRPYYISKSCHMVTKKQRILKLKYNNINLSKQGPILQSIEDSVRQSKVIFGRRMRVQLRKNGNEGLVRCFKEEMNKSKNQINMGMGMRRINHINNNHNNKGDNTNSISKTIRKSVEFNKYRQRQSSCDNLHDDINDIHDDDGDMNKCDDLANVTFGRYHKDSNNANTNATCYKKSCPKHAHTNISDSSQIITYNNVIMSQPYPITPSSPCQPSSHCTTKHQKLQQIKRRLKSSRRNNLPIIQILGMKV